MNKYAYLGIGVTVAAVVIFVLIAAGVIKFKNPSTITTNIITTTLSPKTYNINANNISLTRNLNIVNSTDNPTIFYTFPITGKVNKIILNCSYNITKGKSDVKLGLYDSNNKFITIIAPFVYFYDTDKKNYKTGYVGNQYVYDLTVPSSIILPNFTYDSNLNNITSGQKLGVFLDGVTTSSDCVFTITGTITYQ